MFNNDKKRYEKLMNECSVSWCNTEHQMPDVSEVSEILQEALDTKNRDKNKRYEYYPSLFGDGHIEEPSHRYWFINKKYYPRKKEKKLRKLLEAYVSGKDMQVEFFFDEDLF